MVSYPFFLIEVFNDPTINFKGNTSAIIWLQNPLSDQQMQSMAADLNQPATTFLWQAEEDASFHVRWLAPDAEISLCGHGSLAAVAYLAEAQGIDGEVSLHYREGQIRAKKMEAKRAAISLQAIPVIKEEKISEVLQAGLGVKITAHFSTNNKNIVLLDNEASLRSMQPDFAKLRESEIFGYSVTAPGNDVDFVSRTLVPHVQQLEDPATGSSHAALAPFWAQRLHKREMLAHQLSRRGGAFGCRVQEEEVTLEGQYQVLAQGQWIG